MSLAVLAPARAEARERSPATRIVPRKRVSLPRHVSEGSRSSLPPNPARSRLQNSASSPGLRRISAAQAQASKPSLALLPPVAMNHSAGSRLEIKSNSSPKSKPSSPRSAVPDFLPALADVGPQAITLSKRYKLEFLEVKWILQALQKMKPDQENGGMTPQIFRKFLLMAFETDNLTQELTEGSYAESGAQNGPLDIDSFLHWYKANMFSLVAPARACAMRRESDELIRAVAEKFNLRVVEVDNIHKMFEKFDIDKSGELEYPEFEGMMRQLLGVSNGLDLPKERMSRFWKEMDSNANGVVDFEEFTEWYLKYFTSNNPHGGVLEAFYASYSPDVQRSKGLDEETKQDMLARQDSLLHRSRIPRSRQTIS
mmetsp:Transcript_9363/g.16585  ORF Transcript_9363/g.16585 Transcript_9363/m.16585 type:complete len:370 (+) Transcript_9363:23-1132(+)